MFEFYISKFFKKMHLRAIIHSKIHKRSKVCAGSQLVNTTVGKYSDIGYDCIIVNVSLGAFCSLGCNIKIGGASHSIHWVSTSPVFNQNKDHLPWKFANHAFDPWLKTYIGNDVWIADGVMIKAGVRIGDGAVVGMGSVVTKDIPPYEIWAGNPAKLIKKRFDDSIIEHLLRTQWWYWSDEKISKAAKYMNNVTVFVKKYDAGQ